MILALAFLVAAGLQLAGLWVVWTVLRDLLQSLGRGRFDRLVGVRFGTAERARLLLGTRLFTGCIVLTGVCGAALSLT